MSAPAGFRWSIRDLAVVSPTGVYIVCGDDEKTAQRVPVSRGFSYDGKWESTEVPFVANSICAIGQNGENALILGVGGRVLSWKDGGMVENFIDDSDEGPQYFGDLTEIRKIGGTAYAVGMSRTVYRLEASGAWTRMDAGVRTGDDDDSDAGFTSIDGFSHTDLYAVGWDGEIWHYNGKAWAQEESGTNLILFRVVCGGDDVAYACGQNGIILRGRAQSWEVVDHGATRLKLWGATWFRDQLYVASTKSLFVLNGNTLEPVDIASPRELDFSKNTSFYHLDSNEEVLWSAGRKMLLFTEDGKTWHEPTYMPQCAT